MRDAWEFPQHGSGVLLGSSKCSAKLISFKASLRLPAPGAQVAHGSLHGEGEGVILGPAYDALVPPQHLMRRIAHVLEDVAHILDVGQLVQGFWLVELLSKHIQDVGPLARVEIHLHPSSFSKDKS